MDENKNVVKRNIKDSVFTNLFGNSKYLIELYRALHPEDKEATEQDIDIVTINNILTDGQYNDLGFKISDRLLVLVEAQSTWSVNIVIRILSYLVQTYNQYFVEHDVDLYSSKKVKLPWPELYVIYTGDRANKPEYITLKDEFFAGQDVSIDVKVKVLYDGAPGDIINQYVTFSKIADDQIKKYGRTAEAIQETIRICKDKNVLKEYLISREKEVFDIMLTLYKNEEIIKTHIASEVRDAVGKATRESNIKNTIEDSQFYGVSLSDTIKRISTKYSLSEQDAQDYVDKYWMTSTATGI